MNQENKNEENKEVQNSTDSLKNKPAEQQAKFAQGGQPTGHTQGGQGGTQLPHGGENPRHDEGNEQSEFGRQDS